jgi:hypothetical protein
MNEMRMKGRVFQAKGTFSAKALGRCVTGMLKE